MLDFNVTLVGCVSILNVSSCKVPKRAVGSHFLFLIFCKGTPSHGGKLISKHVFPGQQFTRVMIKS